MGEHLDMGTISNYGVGYLYTYFRQHGIIVSQKDVCQGMRIVDPEGVARRRERKQHQRKRYLVGGPM